MVFSAFSAHRLSSLSSNQNPIILNKSQPKSIVFKPEKGLQEEKPTSSASTSANSSEPLRIKPILDDKTFPQQNLNVLEI